MEHRFNVRAGGIVSPAAEKAALDPESGKQRQGSRDRPAHLPLVFEGIPLLVDAGRLGDDHDVVDENRAETGNPFVHEFASAAAGSLTEAIQRLEQLGRVGRDVLAPAALLR